MRFIERRIVAGILCIATISPSCHGQATSGHLKIGRQNAESELKKALGDNSSNNIINDREVIIKDSLTATNIAEPILFGIYGKTQIIDQRPYEVYHINHYWILNGTLPKTMVGGTFLIILDDRNCKVLKVIHGK